MSYESDPTERTVIAPRPRGPEAAGPRIGSGPRDLPRSPTEALEPQRAPVAPRARRIPRQRFPRIGRAARFLNGLMTFALMAMILVGGAFFGIKLLYDRPGPLPHATVLVIPKGEGVHAIAERLEQEKIIDDSRIFTAAVLWFGSKDKLKAGEYEIRKGASMRQVLNTLIEGRSILHKVTVAEGLTSFQIVERLNESQDLTGEITAIPAEGTLLPDTYKFSRGMSRQELIERMQSEQQRFLKAVWESRAPGLPYKSIEEALIMASIVEKETGRADERNRVAAVFLNRLRQRMRLQSDPTIIYGVTQGKGNLGRGILRSEIDQKTPYNTYQIDGLPPTPICNPGRSAIEATLNPAKTDDLYFVANGQGGHVFARTLDEHNRNVAQWRRIEREAKQAAGAQAGQPPAAPVAQGAAAPAAAAAVIPVAPALAAQPGTAQPAAGEVPLPVRKPKR